MIIFTFSVVMGNGREMVEMFAGLVQDERILKIMLDMPQYPWIPGPSGINLKGGFGSCTGDNLENSSPLGILFKMSLLPNSVNLKASACKFYFISKKTNNFDYSYYSNII